MQDDEKYLEEVIRSIAFKLEGSLVEIVQMVHNWFSMDINKDNYNREKAACGAAADKVGGAKNEKGLISKGPEGGCWNKEKTKSIFGPECVAALGTCANAYDAWSSLRCNNLVSPPAMQLDTPVIWQVLDRKLTRYFGMLKQVDKTLRENKAKSEVKV